MKQVSVVLALILCGVSPGAAAEDARWTEPLQDFFQQHCDDCHAGGASEGGLDLETLDDDLNDAEAMRRWVRLYDRVAEGEMPPEEMPRPDASSKKRFLQQLKATLHAADAQRREVVLRRQNRLEYENTLRDLFAVPHVEVQVMLPEDATAGGFDTVGRALGLSTEQMLAYLDAADLVLDAALGSDEKPETRVGTSSLKDSSERVLGKLFRNHPDGVVLFSSAYSPSAFRGFDIRHPGIYRFKIPVRTFQSDEPMTVRVYAGDVIAKRRDRWLSGYYEVAPGEEWTEIEFEERLEPRDTVKIVTYRNGGHLQDAATTERAGILVGQAECEGPIIDRWPPRSRQQLLGDLDPESATEADAVAVLKRFLPQVYRRRTEPQEVEPYAELTREALAEGRPWLEALRRGLKTMLVSPEFLFLEEPGREQISDVALASRLSYFLWKSLPDAELRRLAEAGKLSDPQTLREQVERLLNDPRSERFIKDFTGQWLDLYEIDFTEPDEKLYPEYDNVLRHAMLKESRQFFAEVLERNLSVGEFLDADWTILNGPLAEHYDISGVEGVECRRVELPPQSPRGGVLTQAAVLKVTANGTNTSPVIRGAWVMENIFGETIPPPPANVPAVEPDISGATTLRQQLEKHRSHRSCASCHRKMDPPGFALERFDAIGGWRPWYRSLGEGQRITDRFIDSPVNRVKVRYRRGPDVDASGELPGGERFADFPEFQQLMADDAPRMAHNLAEKLLTYGLGRTTGFSDRDTLQQVVDRAERDDYGLRTLIHEVVQSAAFRRL